MTDKAREARDLLELYVSGRSADYTRPVLAAMIKFAPTLRGQSNICDAILRCQTPTAPETLSDKLRLLAQRYVNGLLIPMKAQGGKTPKISEHPSRQESMELQSVLNQIHVGVASRDSKLKENALRRDNYRSILSGRLDYESIRNGLIKVMPENPQAQFTQAAHILPFSLAATVAKEQQHRAEIWTILEEFGGMDVLSSLSSNDINRLGNVLTLTETEHTSFGKLIIWLEKDEAPYRYTICSGFSDVGMLGIPLGASVTLGTSDPTLEAPDERFIALHAACAQVLHASGAAEHIDRLIRDMEEMSVLAEDGSSNIFDLFALRGISVH